MRTRVLPVALVAVGLLAVGGCTSSSSQSAVSTTTPAVVGSASATSTPSRELTTVRACVSFLKTTSVVTGQAGISTDPAAWDELVRRLAAVSSGLVEPESAQMVDALTTAASTISQRLAAGDTDINGLVVKYWNPPALEWEQDCTKRGAHMVPALQ